ncbi:hypothetical protein SAMN04489832_7211 [Micromonospora cremea]|uniref:Uncharacterized protein n=1 Tax=Micromonospora cremea TaxID=709881 RepID=A0A1N6A966_9ACTN|nr:hypothetical protein SAMN04489832_5128 [Micromonospora cremea]SIN44263.1 hypothetical protein SAMN04489832_7211 [Micromonospora cremea]
MHRNDGAQSRHTGPVIDNGSPGRPDLSSALRFLSELIAWVATPWALAPHSVPLAVASVVVLVGLPTVFATPGDKNHVLVPVPGAVTIALVGLQLVAAAVSAWFAWPWPAALVVTAVALSTVVTELPRWRRLAPLGPEGRPSHRPA